MDTVTWEQFKAEGFQGFHVGGIVLASDVSGLFGRLVRLSESIGAGVPAEKSHAMLYSGAGNVITQNWRIVETSLQDYTGSILTCWSNLDYSAQARARLIAEARAHLGRLYDLLGIPGQLLSILTGLGIFRKKIQIPWLTYCSEFVCAETRRHLDPNFLAGHSCQINPDALEMQLHLAGWQARTIKLVSASN